MASLMPLMTTEEPTSRVPKDSAPGRRSRVRVASLGMYPDSRPVRTWAPSGVSTSSVIPLYSSGSAPGASYSSS